MTVLGLVHDAFRRDLPRLTEAAALLHGPGLPTAAAVAKQCHFVMAQLRRHHRAEAAHLSPVLRRRLGGTPEGLSVLRDLEDGHHRVAPLISEVESHIDDLYRWDQKHAPMELAGAIGDLGGVVTALLDRDDAELLPLIRGELTATEWDHFEQSQRRGQRLGDLARFVPWILEGAAPEDHDRVLGRLPPPVRLAYRAYWRRSHRRRVAKLTA
ncbi:MAG: hemerythrin domain-containing protein [Acidimicrobiales bacterium]